MLDWTRLRELLAEYRRKSMSVGELAEAIGVAETTVYRIENIKENPTLRPELQTITDWLEKTGGPDLPEFFGLVTARTLPVTPIAEHDSVAATSRTGTGESHGSAVVSSPDSVALAELRRFVLTLSQALAAAAAVTRQDVQGDRPISGSTDKAS